MTIPTLIGPNGAALRRLCFWVLLGCILPAVLGYAGSYSVSWLGQKLDRTFHPSDSWEAAAMLGTCLLSGFYHCGNSAHDVPTQKRLSALVILGTVAGLICVLIGLTWADAFFLRPLGVVIAGSTILIANVLLWRNYKNRAPSTEVSIRGKSKHASEVAAEYSIAVSVIDVPVAVSFMTVAVWCLFGPSKDHIECASFFSGSVAFHMILGNWLFALHQSDYLDSLLRTSAASVATDEAAI